jgi:hypothetical protein
MWIGDQDVDWRGAPSIPRYGFGWVRKNSQMIAVALQSRQTPPMVPWGRY